MLKLGIILLQQNRDHKTFIPIGTVKVAILFWFDSLEHALKTYLAWVAVGGGSLS